MALLGIDLGGTKLEVALFNEAGTILFKQKIDLGEKGGLEVGCLISDEIVRLVNAPESSLHKVTSIGISVPGIYRIKTGTVWAPNIRGWEDYPLLKEVKSVSGDIPVSIDSDRACYILGEVWQGGAKNCKDAIFLSVGTGIGAGILIDGKVLRGAYDIAGCIGWMALSKPYSDEYRDCGCFEHYASGEGIAKLALSIIRDSSDYSGELKGIPAEAITAHHVFAAYENSDPVAVKVIAHCIELWGMAVANLVSLFNPEKVIFGGGVFGPAVKLIPYIKEEVMKWAQPVGVKYVEIVASETGGAAGVYGAGFLAFQNQKTTLTS